ncbi:MAG: Diacylglycerol kinase [Holosporales bacterium]
MLQKLISSTKYSLNGLISCFKREMSFRLEVAFLCANVLLINFLNFSKYERLILIICCFYIMSLELLNSGIEKLADLISTEHHPLIEYAKDVASAAIFLGFVVYGILLWCFLKL